MSHRQQHVTRRDHERQDVHRQGMGGWGLPAGGTLKRRVRAGSGGGRHSSRGAPRPDETGGRGSSVGKGKGRSGAGGGPGVWTTQRKLAQGLRLLHQALGSHGRFLSRDGS